MPRNLALVPVGVGAAYGRPGDVQSAYLVRAADRTVCLDLGAGTLNRMCAHVAPETLDAVVISHLHPDHCADLFALRVYMAWGPGAGRRLRILGPAGLRDRLVAFSGSEGWDRCMDFEELQAGGGEVDLGGGLVLRYAEVPHLPPTFASRLDFRGASVCFGADCGPNDALPALADGCDVLLAECSFGAAEASADVGHLNARDAAAIAERAGAGRLVMTHLYPEHDPDAALTAARAATAVPVEWAVPGHEVAA
ncbi:MAG: MBL fold metallo-hydrolase [Actinomycetota bacterium]